MVILTNSSSMASNNTTPRKGRFPSIARRSAPHNTLEGYLTTEQPLKHQLSNEREAAAEFSPQHDARSLMSFAMPVGQEGNGVDRLSLLGDPFGPFGGSAEPAEKAVEPFPEQSLSPLLDRRRTSPFRGQGSPLRHSSGHATPVQNSEATRSPLNFSSGSSSGSPLPRLRFRSSMSPPDGLQVSSAAMPSIAAATSRASDSSPTVLAEAPGQGGSENGEVTEFDYTPQQQAKVMVADPAQSAGANAAVFSPLPDGHSPDIPAKLPPGALAQAERLGEDSCATVQLLSSPEVACSPVPPGPVNRDSAAHDIGTDSPQHYPSLKVTSGDEGDSSPEKAQQRHDDVEEEEGERAVLRVSVPVTEAEDSDCSPEGGRKRGSPESQSDRFDSDTGLRVRAGSGDRRMGASKTDVQMEALLSARWQSQESAMWPAGLSSTEEDTENELRQGIRVRVAKDSSRRGLRLGGRKRGLGHSRREADRAFGQDQDGASGAERRCGSEDGRRRPSTADADLRGARNGSGAAVMTTSSRGRQTPSPLLLPAQVKEAPRSPASCGQGTGLGSNALSTHAQAPPPQEQEPANVAALASKAENVASGDTEAALMEASDNMAVLRCPSLAMNGEDCVVFLVGTAHVSKESCEEVRKIIRLVKPDVVFLEICPERVAMLLPQDELQEPSLGEIMKALRDGHTNAFAVLYSWLLAKVANKVEVLPGAEFRAAYEEAAACGAMVKLGDRPVQITLKRTWGMLSSWHKIRLISSFLLGLLWLPSKNQLKTLVEEMKQGDMLTEALDELSKIFPPLVKTLIHERDLFMAAMLRHVAQRSSAVVAVVGKGHMKGIEENWERTDIDVKALLELPPDPPPLLSSPYVKYGIVVLVASSTALIVTMKYFRSRA